MTYKVYIESVNGWPIGDWGVSAWQGFREMGVECILFEQIEEVPKSKLSIVVACVETTHKFLSYMNIAIPRPMNIPTQLNNMRNLSRLIWEGTLDGLHYLEDKYFPLFIKPADVTKQFVAGVVKNLEQYNLFLGHLPRATRILCSQPIDIVSEYRAYIYGSTLRGIYWYTGDFRIFPDVNKVDEMIEEFTWQPKGFSLDVGITKEGKTILIECNDGYSLGNYGLAPDKYAKLLGRRWRELMSK